jgi:DNA polymerase-3 subunit epsilon/ATP-dependent DNA helicase DinG
LNSLSNHFGISLEQHHRALNDARATASLYWELWKLLLKQPTPILQEICQALAPFEWGTGAVFRAACAELGSGSSTPMRLTGPALQPAGYDSQSRAFGSQDIHPISTEAITAIFDDDGKLESSISGFELRREQQQMAQAVTDALNNQQHLLIEAGTGTGKSLAYLIPAARWAVENNQHVVVSTNTLNLQDQLLRKDIPIVQEIIGTEVRASVLKGRSNYLCPRRLETMRRRKPGSLEELKTLAKILIWLQSSPSGEKSEITLRFTEHSTWSRLSADDEDCNAGHCHQHMQGICPYFKAHSAAQDAHLIITNHALLVQDAVHGHQVLPDYQYLIVDEAHQLEDAITNSMSMRVDLPSVQHRLNDLGNLNFGLLGDLTRTLVNRIPEKQFIRLERFVQDIGDALQSMANYAEKFFSTVHSFAQNRTNQFSFKVTIDQSSYRQENFLQIQRSWVPLDEHFEVITDSLIQLAGALSKLDSSQIPDLETHRDSLIAISGHLSEMRIHLRKFSQNTDTNTIYWINCGSNLTETSIQNAVIHIGKLMTEHLWNKKQSVVLTGATLQTANSFDYIRDRLAADHVAEMVIGSPFHYKSSSLVYSVSDIPAPNEPGYQKALERGIIELADALGGKLLVLFTSYQQLRETAANISPRLALGGIAVMDQISGGTRDSLVTDFISAQKAVLLGTRSFWEGIDIPGDDLSAIIISKLPFAVPSDPVFAARSATYANSFGEYAMPDAILRFRQGFGRLIRTRTDRGVVAIFDSRVIHKSYGAKFLQSLPEVTLQSGSLNDLPGVARTWLEK